MEMGKSYISIYSQPTIKAPLIDHHNLWHYIEGGGESKHHLLNSQKLFNMKKQMLFKKVSTRRRLDRVIR